MATPKLLLSFLLVCILIKSNAQTTFGVKAGVNFSTIQNYPGYEDGAKAKTGFNVGVFTNIPLSKHFSLRPEVLFSKKGTKLESSYGHVEITTRYLSVPVLVSYSLSKHLSFDIGPGFNLLMRRPVYGFSKFDLTADAGFRYSYKKFGLDFRYEYGLTKFIDVSYIDPVSNQIRNEKMGSTRCLQFSIFYVLCKKH